MEPSIESVLEEVRERLRLHAGGLTLVDVDQARGIVSVRFEGTCRHCPLSAMTLHHGVEQLFKERLPWCTSVVAIP